MRALLIPLLLLTACGSQEPTVADNATAAAPGGKDEIFASGPRDRLCLKPGEQRAAIVTYAASGDANCAVRGSWNGNKLTPDGEDGTSGSACTIPLRQEGDTLVISAPTPGCAYYCGPGASLENKTFSRMDNPEPVTDLAGDPLC